MRRLLGRYDAPRRPRRGEPFKSLVSIVLSQNTSYLNEAAAFERLDRIVGVEPESIAAAPVEVIADAIRPAGMHNLRSRTLKRLAEAVLALHGGDLAAVLEKPYLDSREELMRLPGVGKKTADVLLLFEADKAVIPVDRHIMRIAQRLRLVPAGADYDEVRRSLEEAATPEAYLDVHVLLIRFGREICRAQRPRCGECFLNDLCPFHAAVTQQSRGPPPQSEL